MFCYSPSPLSRWGSNGLGFCLARHQPRAQSRCRWWCNPLLLKLYFHYTSQTKENMGGFAGKEEGRDIRLWKIFQRRSGFCVTMQGAGRNTFLALPKSCRGIQERAGASHKFLLLLLLRWGPQWKVWYKDQDSSPTLEKAADMKSTLLVEMASSRPPSGDKNKCIYCTRMCYFFLFSCNHLWLELFSA